MRGIPGRSSDLKHDDGFLPSQEFSQWLVHQTDTPAKTAVSHSSGSVEDLHLIPMRPKPHTRMPDIQSCVLTVSQNQKIVKEKEGDSSEKYKKSKDFPDA